MDFRVPHDLAEIANTRLIAAGAAPSIRRDALAVLALVSASLAPLSLGTERRPEELAQALGLPPERWRQVIAALEAADILSRVRRRGGTQFLAIRPPGVASHGRPRNYPPSLAGPG